MISDKLSYENKENKEKFEVGQASRGAIQCLPLTKLLAIKRWAES